LGDALAVRRARPMLLGFASAVNHDDRHLRTLVQDRETPTLYIESRACVCNLQVIACVRRRR
jgi:hypothetical protein